MTKGTRTRLILFAVLSAVGIVYVAASYLGVVNAILGRNQTVYVDLPNSGGTYIGSEVDYRGVKIGKVSDMSLTATGVQLKLTLDPGVKVPKSSALMVSNLTAIGEQYVNFIPKNDNGPYADNNYHFKGSAGDLPESTDNLLLTLNGFVNSVNPQDLTTAVGELGTMFKDNSDALGTIIDQGSKFLKGAQQHQASTIQLLNAGGSVLDTQIAHETDLKTFTAGLSTLTAALKNSDANLRTILNTGALREADGLVNDLRSTLPAFLNNLVPVTQVISDRRRALEQTLVVFPPVVSSGFTGTPGDGYGHLNMQFDYAQSPCSGTGYLPHPWPAASNLADLPLYPARCNNPKAQPSYHGSDGILQRGSNMVPPVNGSGAAYRTSTQASTGSTTAGTTTPNFATPQSVMGSGAWVWMLVGPVSPQ
jgi:phospholipid/cholesterol/gamma-HCH transport system substrate-binding protein